MILIGGFISPFEIRYYRPVRSTEVIGTECPVLISSILRTLGEAETRLSVASSCGVYCFLQLLSTGAFAITATPYSILIVDF